VTYRDGEELLEKAEFYLRREGLRERIAAAGRARALAEHTYRHRMERLLAEAEKGAARKVVPVSAPAPPGAPAPRGPGDLRQASYFEFERPEVLALVPASARRVLDVGCGAGRFGAALKARQGATVVGIELDGEAAGEARRRLDEVLVGDVERLEPGFAPGSFDAVVCADVLEHLRSPQRLLRRVRGWLAPGGLLVASVPNVRHHSVVRSLLDGNWTYEPAGLLDRTHLRFFTRRALARLLEQSGFTLTGGRVVPGPGYEEWQRRGRPGEVQAGGLHVRGLGPDEAEELYVYQYLITAAPILEGEGR
jgi:O-antigen biosynthesis protein